MNIQSPSILCMVTVYIGEQHEININDTNTIRYGVG